MSDHIVREITNRVLDRLHQSAPPPGTAPPVGPDALHPSQERFPRTAADLPEMLEFLQAKACTFEADKPCDQCDRCNTRGF